MGQSTLVKIKGRCRRREVGRTHQRVMRRLVMPTSKAQKIARRQFLGGAAATLAAGVGTTLSSRGGWASAPTVHKSGTLEALVVSDGHFVLPTGFLVTPDAPPVEREAALRAAGHGGDKIQLVNNVTVIRSQSDVILVDAGSGPRHQPTAGKLVENLKSRRHPACSGYPGRADSWPSRSSVGRPRRQRQPDLSECELCRLRRRMGCLGGPGCASEVAGGLPKGADRIARAPRTTSRASRIR